MKVLEICEFSAGICGVWTRVFHEARLLKKLGHEVYIFSSDIEKGTGRRVNLKELREGIRICRFPSRRTYLSENVHSFGFADELKALNPDIVITHLIHPHSFKALKICKKLKIPCIIVTHAPFGINRRFPLNIITWAYYHFNVKRNLKRFNKIIAITRWEAQYLLGMNISKDDMSYVPNGIPSEFFREKIKKFSGRKFKNIKIMFLGRISPVKNIETLISSFKMLNSKNTALEIIGPVEKGYEQIRNYAGDRIIFSPQINGIKAKIRKLQEADIFVLPSYREGLPQSLIEAMALGKIVIASDTLGAKEVVKDGKNGFLFKIGDKDNLMEKIKCALNMKRSKIFMMQKNARNSVKSFEWNITIIKLNKLIKNYKK